MPKAKPITDHTGKVHKSLTELCEYWGICRDTYVSRMRSGKYTMEKALTLPVESNARIVTDHLGNSFENTMKMCDYWGIPLNTYRSRRAVLNWTLEKSLTEPLYIWERQKVQ